MLLLDRSFLILFPVVPMGVPVNSSPLSNSESVFGSESWSAIRKGSSHHHTSSPEVSISVSAHRIYIPMARPCICLHLHFPLLFFPGHATAPRDPVLNSPADHIPRLHRAWLLRISITGSLNEKVLGLYSGGSRISWSFAFTANLAHFSSNQVRNGRSSVRSCLARIQWLL